MKYIIKVLIVAATISLSSCIKDVNLTHEELSWFNVYKEGDELVFRNFETQQTDTSVIIKKEIYRPKYDWFRHNGYRIQIARLKYKNKALIYGNNGEDAIIEIHKRKIEQKIEPSVSYLYSTFFSDESDFKLRTITLDSTQKTFSQVYVFTKKKGINYKEKYDNWKPLKLYWDKDHGIIKYVTYKGDVWERINW